MKDVISQGLNDDVLVEDCETVFNCVSEYGNVLKFPCYQLDARKNKPVEVLRRD